MTRKVRHWLVLAAGTVLLAALLVRSVRHNPEWQTFRWSAFLDSLLALDKGWTLWAILAVYATYVVRALRWKVIMRHFRPDANLWKLLSATVIGFAAIGVLGRAGEMVRPYLVARKEGVSISGQLAVWLVERCFDTLTLLATAAFALSRFDAAGIESPSLKRMLNLGGTIVAAGTTAVIVLMFVLHNYAQPFTAWLIGRVDRFRVLSAGRRRAVEHALAAFEEGTRGVRSLKTLAACVLYSIAEWILIALCFAAVFRAVGGDFRPTWDQTLIFMGCVLLGSMINIPGIGGGIQIASVLVLTELFGMRPEPASGIALLIWGLTFLAVVPPALLLMAYEGLSWGMLRRLESEN